MSTKGAEGTSPYFEEFAALSPRGYGTREDGTIRFGLDGYARPVDVRMSIHRSEAVDDPDTLANLVVSVPYPPERAGGSGGAYRGRAPEAAPLLLRDVVLQAEAPLDRHAKRAGLAREVQVGDARFDDRVYVDTNADPAEVRKLLADGGLRELVLRALSMGMIDVRIATKDAIVAVASPRDGVKADHVAEVAKLATELGDRLPPIRHVETRWGRELWPLSAAALMFVAAMVLYWFADHRYPTADSWLDHGRAAIVAFSSLGIALPLAWLLARGRSEARFRFIAYAVAFSLVFPFFTYMGAWFGNGFFDRSPEIRTVVRLHQHWKSADDEPRYSLRIDSWRPFDTTIELKVTEAQYQRVTQPTAELVEIVRRPGALGADWLVDVRRK